MVLDLNLTHAIFYLISKHKLLNCFGLAEHPSAESACGLTEHVQMTEGPVLSWCPHHERLLTIEDPSTKCVWIGLHYYRSRKTSLHSPPLTLRFTAGTGRGSSLEGG